MSSPMSVYGHDAHGHCITIFIAVTSGGAASQTITIPAGSPAMDLSKAHPVISGAYFAMEGDTVVNCVELLPAGECVRGETPDTLGEYAIATATTIAVMTPDLDGFLALSYWAAGAKQV